MNNSEWNSFRARLHHDWLQNSYLVFLNARAENMDESVKDKKEIRKDVREQFAELLGKNDDFNNLFNAAINALSPAQLIDEHPLNTLSKENKTWLKELVHAMYLERTDIHETLVKLTAQWGILCDMYAALVKILDGKDKKTGKHSDKLSFIQFRGNIQKMSKMISALPHEVQVA